MLEIMLVGMFVILIATLWFEPIRNEYIDYKSRKKNRKREI